ncbi:MAG TPA: lysozyme inhibitor LprI family protein [Hyphomicrobiaceae bacterium]|nr:lysozyme inhibitor LprI family protein [Hyphomicrobiaceae bacterium]
MRRSPLILAAAAMASVAFAMPASAASFDCDELGNKNAAERRICQNQRLGALDERLDSWYRRALERAKYFDQTGSVRSAQRAWLRSRNECGASVWCLRRHYVSRIRELKRYVEHV